MKTGVLTTFALLIFIITGCSSGVSQTTLTLGQEFTMSVGQSISISEEDLKIKLTDVVGDSRCPSGVTCIWAGQVSCILEITQNNRTDQTVITASGGKDYSSSEYQMYNLKFRVDPYPQSGKTINKSDYRLVLTISKN